MGRIKIISIFVIFSFFLSLTPGKAVGRESYHENEVPEKLEYSFGEQPVLLTANFEEDPKDYSCTYHFDWGDGASTEWLPSKVAAHTYERTGYYLASVSMRDSENRTYSRYVSITIHRDYWPPPERGFTKEEVAFIAGGISMYVSIFLAILISFFINKKIKYEIS